MVVAVGVKLKPCQPLENQRRSRAKQFLIPNSSFLIPHYVAGAFRTTGTFLTISFRLRTSFSRSIHRFENGTLLVKHAIEFHMGISGCKRQPTG
jgi:hypothetical protein